ncbi:OsmC family protein [Ginsengibacter hankyongi]|uniref:OsmC family protein n=1 Tax=Ginsengibacter hankyongi TaxID=2607284 RepID=A0A5J5IGF3_9BACT|nr:OsmC family protein [Ginsengibacter hankyongi]KAA9038431.1 OsmC family protein [Ginsengibacter hankyongi]
MTASIVYTGNLRCEAEHVQSKTITETDAPTDNRGKGEKFSPTDLLCVSVATCMLTTMAIKAGDLQVDITDAKADVTKHMFSNPRRVGKIEVMVTLPPNGNERDRKVLEKTGDNCPVIKSIHPDIELVINYKWG